MSNSLSGIGQRVTQYDKGMTGPLSGFRIVEIAGIGPGPFAAMMLSDMGAEVIRVERAQAVRGPAPETPYFDVLQRGRQNIAIDLKNPEGVETLLQLVESADALIEGFRPGVMERLGIGPDVCLARNPKLVFGRMTGWGQTGMYAQAAGHDINYISLAGALAHFGRAGEGPVPPMNMVGDFGGGNARRPRRRNFTCSRRLFGLLGRISPSRSPRQDDHCH